LKKIPARRGTILTTQRRRIGPVERKVKADIAALITAHPMGEALTQMALTLAAAMDRIQETGKGLMVLPAVSRELRDNLAELSRLAVNDDDPLADELSTPLRDSAES
jgi:hypothetical protein